MSWFTNGKDSGVENENQHQPYAMDTVAEMGGFVISPYEGIVNQEQYREMRLSSAQKMHISAFVQQIPQFGTSLSVGSGNLFQAKFPEGLPKTLMQLKQGGFSSTIIGENGKFAGTASLYPVSTVTGITLGVFTVLSMATSQYFLTEINDKLNKLDEKLDAVLAFLYGDKKSELIAELRFVQDAQQSYSAIMGNEAHRIATIVSIQNSKKVAMKDIEFYINDLSSKTSKYNSKGKKEPDRAIAEILKTKEYLILALQLYSICAVLEVYYSQNFDEDYLQYVKSDVAGYVNKCEKRILRCFSNLKGRMEGNQGKRLAKQAESSPQEKQVQKVIDELSDGNNNSILDAVNRALQQPIQPQECLVSADGKVYVATS